MKDVLIIGGGAVGLCTAYYLHARGRRVTVLDQTTLRDGASTGNAGMIVPSHVVPLAAPGVIAKGLKWLLNPESPFFIKPRLDPALIAWLWRFRAACTNDNVARGIPVLRDLSLTSTALLDDLAASPGLGDFGLAHTGLLMVYRSEKGRKENLETADLAEAAGLDIDRLDADATLALEPAICSPQTGSVFYRQDARIDPDRFVEVLARSLQDAGVMIHTRTTVQGLEHRNGLVTAVRTNHDTFEADEIVLAAGAWTGRLAKMLGLNVPVQPAKGYSLTVETGHPLRIPLILTEEKVTVTPMPGRIRFGGTLALAGFDPSAEPRRVAPIRRQMQAYCPDLPADDVEHAPVWTGYRPCSPDGLPILGRAAPFRNLTLATGHGMMGATLAPVTGKLIAELLDGEPPSLDLHPLRPDRFSNKSKP